VSTLQTDHQSRDISDSTAVELKSRSSWFRRALADERWWLRIAFFAVLLLYVRAVDFSPVYDDNIIGEGGTGTWRDIPRFFAHDLFGGDGQAHSVYYRPLSQAYGFIVCKLTGGAPGWQHLSAILLHLAVMGLAYLAGRRLFGDGRFALLTAVLFALHPSKVESVAWIGSSYVDGLSGALFFATVIAFLRWHQSGARVWLAVSIGLYGCALLTKETMLVLPALFASYLLLKPPVRWPLRVSLAQEDLVRRVLRTLVTLLPFAIVLVAYMVVRHQVIKPTAAAVVYRHPTYTLDYLWTAPQAIIWYVRHLVFPTGLSVEYVWSAVKHPTLVSFVLPAVAVLIGLAISAWLCRRSVAAVLLLLWFVLTLAPPVVVAPMVDVHDRYLYLACYPFCALLAWGILRLRKLHTFAPAALALTVSCLFLISSWHELQYWECDRSLWTRVVAISPSHIGGRVQVAGFYYQDGDFPHALAAIDEGLRYHPDSPGLWLTRANFLNGEKRIEEARADYLRVLRATEPAADEPLTGTLLRSRYTAAYELARLEITARNYNAAERYARIAIALNPSGPNFHTTLAAALKRQGKDSEARAEGEFEMRQAQARRAAQH
jgi:hypothetical protein